MSNRPPPPTEDDLYKLYDEVRRGFLEEPLPNPTLNDILIPRSDPDDLSTFIDDYRDRNREPPQKPPEYGETIRKQPPPEKGVCL